MLGALGLATNSQSVGVHLGNHEELRGINISHLSRISSVDLRKRKQRWRASIPRTRCTLKGELLCRNCHHLSSGCQPNYVSRFSNVWIFRPSTTNSVLGWFYLADKPSLN